MKKKIFHFLNSAGYWILKKFFTERQKLFSDVFTYTVYNPIVVKNANVNFQDFLEKRHGNKRERHTFVATENKDRPGRKNRFSPLPKDRDFTGPNKKTHIQTALAEIYFSRQRGTNKVVFHDGKVDGRYSRIPPAG